MSSLLKLSFILGVGMLLLKGFLQFGPVQAKNSTATQSIAKPIIIQDNSTLATAEPSAIVATIVLSQPTAEPVPTNQPIEFLGTASSPLRDKTKIFAVENDLAQKNAKLFKKDGWYLLSYTTIQPSQSAVIAPETEQPLTASVESLREWFYVQQGKITDRITLTYDGHSDELLQVAVSHGGTAVNLTGYNNEAMRPSSIFSDDNYGKKIEKLSGIEDLLKGMPDKTKFKAWKYAEKGVVNYQIHATQPPASDGLAIEYQFEHDEASGKVVHWQAGFRANDGTFSKGLELTNMNIIEQEQLPEDIASFFTQGQQILKEHSNVKNND